jgi:hypothetical protein
LSSIIALSGLKSRCTAPPPRASGVLQLVSPWSTSTLPISFAIASASSRSSG